MEKYIYDYRCCTTIRLINKFLWKLLVDINGTDKMYLFDYYGFWSGHIVLHGCLLCTSVLEGGIRFNYHNWMKSSKQIDNERWDGVSIRKHHRVTVTTIRNNKILFCFKWIKWIGFLLMDHHERWILVFWSWKSRFSGSVVKEATSCKDADNVMKIEDWVWLNQAVSESRLYEDF